MVEEDQEVTITRRGKSVARQSPVHGSKKPLDLTELAKFRASMPKLSRPSNKLIRQMRDEGY